MPITNSLKTYAIQIGQSATDTQNFQLSANNDGTGKLARKSDGTGGDILSWDANGLVTQTKQMTLGTAQATTSGTFIDFTGIPSWAKRITVSFAGVSTSGISHNLVQIGSGAIDTTGYLSCSAYVVNSTSNTQYTTGFGILVTQAVSTVSGTMVLVHLGGNVWSESLVIANYVDNHTVIGGGTKTLSGALDRVRLTTVNGTDTFDAGSVNILYEG